MGAIRMAFKPPAIVTKAHGTLRVQPVHCGVMFGNTWFLHSVLYMFPHEEFARKVGLRTWARKVRRRAYADLPGMRQGVPEHLVGEPRLQALPCQCDLETGL